MHEVVAVARGETAFQLALAGVPVVEASDAGEAGALISRYLQGDDTARLLIVDETYREGLSERLRLQILRHRGLPLVIYCPSFDRDKEDVDKYLATMLKPAIGYEIRLE